MYITEYVYSSSSSCSSYGSPRLRRSPSLYQHTSACVSIRQHKSAYVSVRQHTSVLLIAVTTSPTCPARQVCSTAPLFEVDHVDEGDCETDTQFIGYTDGSVHGQEPFLVELERRRPQGCIVWYRTPVADVAGAIFAKREHVGPCDTRPRLLNAA